MHGVLAKLTFANFSVAFKSAASLRPHLRTIGRHPLSLLNVEKVAVFAVKARHYPAGRACSCEVGPVLNHVFVRKKRCIAPDTNIKLAGVGILLLAQLLVGTLAEYVIR